VTGDVLDLGCGQKPYETIFTNTKSYIGVDVKVSGHNHNNSKIDVFYDGKKLPFLDNSFDSIVCFEVLEHVFDVDELLSEVSRVLKAEGVILITTPFMREEHEIPYDFARYTNFGLTYLLKKNNFKVLDLIKTTSSVIAIGQLFVNYIANHILPNGRFLGKLSQLIVVFPINILFLIFDRIFQKKNSMYCNLVVLAKNIK
jgi:ubiquinone/menaquinone biosynthesis C-methylase UbiE